MVNELRGKTQFNWFDQLDWFNPRAFRPSQDDGLEVGGQRLKAEESPMTEKGSQKGGKSNLDA